MDDQSREIRANVLRVSHHSGHGHIPTCFSIIEMLRAVYETMSHDPANPKWDRRDLFVLSKGHAALGLYCTLSHYGYFPMTEVYTFGSFGATFGCHPDRSKVPGVEVSTGSLGHGIGVAAGMALAAKVKASGQRVYVVIGDGESNEGTVWETLMVAAQQKLDNLTVLFDQNGSQIRCLPIAAAEEKFRAFGCCVSTVDGHDVTALKQALQTPDEGKPRVVVAKTTKGFGCATLSSDMFAWHRRSPNAQELSTLLEELNA